MSDMAYTAAEIREAYEKAEADLLALSTEYDAARAALKADFGPRLEHLNTEVGHLQKHMLNHEVLESLNDEDPNPVRAWAALNALRSTGWNGGPTDEEATEVFGCGPDEPHVITEEEAQDG